MSPCYYIHLIKSLPCGILYKEYFKGVFFLFQIGDKIVYPMHGAGIVEAVEEREVLGEKNQYYVMNMSLGNMQVFIPVGKEENFGLRLVVDGKTIDEALNQSWIDAATLPTDSNQRYRYNMEK